MAIKVSTFTLAEGKDRSRQSRLWESKEKYLIIGNRGVCILAIRISLEPAPSPKVAFDHAIKLGDRKCG
jgi:hypothetical protein